MQSSSGSATSSPANGPGDPARDPAGGSPEGSNSTDPGGSPGDRGSGDSRIDGRSARALKTREAIVDACIILVEEGELRPTAPRVAERAGVSVRSVFQHFADLPSLHIAVTERVTERLAVLLHPVDASRPLDERIETFIHYRAALLEAVTPFRRAANVHGPFAPEIRRALRRATTYLRDEVARAFRPELEAVADTTERYEVLEGLSTMLSWSAWDALRTDGDCTVEQATAITRRVIRALLGARRTDG